jgi:hypothetical protein
LIFNIIISLLLTEAITELAVKSEFFHPLRKFLFESNNKLFNYIHKLFDCGYCFSVWAGMLSIFLVFYLDNFVIDFLVLGLVVHRLSNILHFFIDLISRFNR